MASGKEAVKEQGRLVLASGSPRRRELLDRLGWTYVVSTPDVDENISGTPREVVLCLCERKARTVAEEFPQSLILGADTLVSVDGEALGKPCDAEDARRMLGLLSGRAHEVLTGVCLLEAGSGRAVRQVECTKIRFRALTEREIDDYVLTGEPMDKAGAYAIQGRAAAFVETIEGSFENAMGLPVQALPDMRGRLLSAQWREGAE